jgi:hypothetical protein
MIILWFFAAIVGAALTLVFFWDEGPLIALPFAALGGSVFAVIGALLYYFLAPNCRR